MKKNFIIILTILSIGLLSSCDKIRNNFTYGNKAKDFMTDLMNKDYDKCIGLMEVSNNTSRKTYVDSIKQNFDTFRGTMVKKFGENVDYAYLYAFKSRSFELKEIPGRTTVRIQASNNKDMGAIDAVFDDKTGKIISVNPHGLEEAVPIPDMTDFWIFGLIAICVPIFNIYMLKRVYKSDMADKWQKYLAIIVCNFPAIGYGGMQGLAYAFFADQYFLGFNFIKAGYASTWILAIPLGSLYIFWMLKKGKYTRDPNIKLKTKAKK